MPTFQYEAMNAAGQAVKDKVEAASAEEAVSKIKMLGQYPTKVKESRTKLASSVQNDISRTSMPRRRRRWRGGISATRLAEFTQQLSTLQDAGMPIVRSLKILWQQERAGVLKETLAEVSESVENGATLSEALARHPKVFDRLYVNMVQAGEVGGVLDVILQRLAEFLEKCNASAGV